MQISMHTIVSACHMVASCITSHSDMLSYDIGQSGRHQFLMAYLNTTTRACIWDQTVAKLA